MALGLTWGGARGASGQQEAGGEGTPVTPPVSAAADADSTSPQQAATPDEAQPELASESPSAEVQAPVTPTAEATAAPPSTPAAGAPQAGGEQSLQTAPPSNAAPVGEGPPVSPIYADLKGKLEVVGPDTYWLVDKDGNLQRVINLSYEDFLKLVQLQEGGSDSGATLRPQYTHQQLEVKGELKPDYAQFTATMEITLHTADPVEVPLRFGASILRQQPQAPPRADGRFLSFVPEKGGWVATLQGQPGERVTIVLDFITPLERNGDRSTLRLLVPRAIVGKLSLDSPSIIETPSTPSEGVVLRTLPLGTGGGEGTRIEADGLGGEFRLSWEEQQEEKTTESATVLVSRGALRYEIDASNVRTTATLDVSSLGAPFDTFRVQIPAGDEYVRHEDLTFELASAGGRVINSVEKELPTEGETSRGGQIYVVKLNETKGPVRLRLSTNHPLERDGEKGRARLHGFEVLGAVRQDGEIGVAVDDQLQLSFSAENLQQINLSELAAGRRASGTLDELTALRYYSQPWALDLEVARRERRVTATTDYAMEIHEDEILLDMTVAYVITGPGQRGLPISLPLNFDLRSWELTTRPAESQLRPVETQGFEDATEAVPAESRDHEGGANILRFPYASATDSRPRMVLHLRRNRPDHESFELDLPFVADAFAMGTGSVKMKVMAPGLQFTPNPAKMEGLAPQPMDHLTVLDPTVAPGQQFEYRGFLPEPVFAGSLRSRSQRVSWSGQTRVDLIGQRALVEQTILLDIRYQPLEELALVIPSDIVRDEDFEVSWRRPDLSGATSDDADSDTVRLDLPLISEGATSAAPELRIPLTPSQLGKLEVIVRYGVEVPSASSEAPWIIPLVTPSAEAEMTRQTVRVNASDGHVFTPAGGSKWRVDAQEENSEGAPQFTSHEPLNYLPLTLRRLPRAAGVTDIERIWLQTWLTEEIAQQRLAVVFRSSEAEAVIELPEGVNSDDVEVLLDGLQVIDARGGAAQLVVPLTGGELFTSRTIEIRYRQPHRFTWIEPLTLEVPRLAGNETLAEMYWQVITPTRHLALQTPPGCVDAYTCHWNSGDWRAEGDHNTVELESWIGGVSRQRPTLAEHTLLWRGDPRRATLEVWLIRRELIVLACSTAVLGLSLMLLYLPVLRRRGVWLTLGVAVAALGIMYPNTARLVAQGGLLGGLATMVAMALAAVSRRAEPDSTVSSPSMGSTIIPSASRGSSIAPLGSGNLSTNAPTVSVEMSDASS